MIHLSINQMPFIIGINYLLSIIMTTAIDRLPTVILAETLSDVVARLLSPQHCSLCNHRLKLYHIIPILSFFGLNHRCFYCKDFISKKYMLTEVSALLIALGCCFGTSNIETTLYHMLIINCLWMISFIDFEHQIIPDTLSLGGIWLIITWNLLINNHGLKASVSGACIAYLILTTFSWIYRRIRNQFGLGGGDIKLFALIGAWLGPNSLLATLLIASSLALICSLIHFRSRWHPQIALPFGPYLAIAAIILHGYILLILN